MTYVNVERNTSRGVHELVKALKQFGEQMEQHYTERYDYEPDEHSYFDIEVGSWTSGPLLTITKFDADGEPRVAPTIGSRMTRAVINAGYIPWGFRPHTDGDREMVSKGEFLWYLYPLDDDPFDFEYDWGVDDGERLLTNEEGKFVTFKSKDDAEAIAERIGGEAVEVMT